jgi:ketosteroid isomerase-like protein
LAATDLARTAIRFVNEINRHDVEAIGALLAHDHVLVDPLGHELRGPERAREAWAALFAKFPEYRISIEDTLEAGPVVGLIGSVSGSLPTDPTAPASHRWRLPAAWKAVVRDGRIERWQMYADQDPIRKMAPETSAAPAH